MKALRECVWFWSKTRYRYNLRNVRNQRLDEKGKRERGNSKEPEWGDDNIAGGSFFWSGGGLEID
jgi:hypothetical protein